MQHPVSDKNTTITIKFSDIPQYEEDVYLLAPQVVCAQSPLRNGRGPADVDVAR